MSDTEEIPKEELAAVDDLHRRKIKHLIAFLEAHRGRGDDEAIQSRLQYLSSKLTELDHE